MNKVLPAVKAIIKNGNKFIVIKQKLPGKTVWDLPGGKVDYGESPLDTLLREVKEEINLSIKILKPIGIFWFFRNNMDQIVCTTFLCTPISENVDLSNNPADENIIEYKWVTKKEFLSNKYRVSHKSMKRVISLINNLS